MMRAQLADIRERGEPIAALWASEETIYGRFGYGLATQDAMIRAPRVSMRALRSDLPGRTGTTRLVGHDEALRVLPARLRPRSPPIAGLRLAHAGVVGGPAARRPARAPSRRR